MRHDFFNRIHTNPIIAAVGDIKKLEKAIVSPCEIIFLLTGSIFNLKDLVNKAKEADKKIYIHVDLIDGFSRDVVSLKYINDYIKPDGIITTKSNLIRNAKEMGLITIQRLFILDSLSLETGINIIKNTKPDAVEVMPGIMPKVIEYIHSKSRTPIITGGLIMDKKDLIQSLKAGAIGISTSSEDVWQM